jgi:hypothetical protein
MTQLTFPGLSDARAARDEAIRRAGENANPEWSAGAMAVVCQLANKGSAFTTDDVHELLDQLVAAGRVARTHEPRALGAVMREAHKLGLIVPLDQWRQSKRRACHSRPLRVWRPA